MSLTDGVTPLNAANIPHKSGSDSITGQWDFTKPVATPGGVNFTKNGSMETWNAGAAVAPTDWTLNGAGATIARDGANFKVETYAAALTRVGTDCYLSQRVDQNFGPAVLWQGQPVVLGGFVRATVASRVRIGLNDGVGSSFSSYHSGGSGWEWLAVTRTIDAAATQLEIRLQIDTGDTTAQFDGIVFALGSGLPNSLPWPSGLATTATGDVVGTYKVVGLQGKNNTVTPNTQYDLTADQVQLRNPTTGIIVVRNNPGTITCDVALAGPAANGRDQLGVFSPSSWIHFYFIWNGTTLATVASATAPTTGPTLPAGYTHWAYAGAVYFNGSSQLLATRIRGNTAWYASNQTALSGGAATSETAISLTALVPPNNLRAYFGCLVNVTSGAGAGSVTFTARAITGADFARPAIASSNVASLATQTYASFVMPVLGQQIFYLLADTGQVASRALDLYVTGYTVPNGGE
jgi:hypothetical protein